MNFGNLHITKNGDKITLGVSSGIPTDGTITELEKDNTSDSLWQKFVALKETMAKNALQFNELKEIVSQRAWNNELYEKKEAIVESVQLGEDGVHKDGIKLDKYEDGVVRATFVKSGEIVVFAEFDAEQGSKLFEKYKKVQSSIDESKQFLGETKADVEKNGAKRWWSVENTEPKEKAPETEANTRPYTINGIQYISEEKGHLISIETPDGQRGYLYKKDNQPSYEILKDGIAIGKVDDKDLLSALQNSEFIKAKTISMNLDEYRKGDKIFFEKNNPEHEIHITGRIAGTNLLSVIEFYPDSGVRPDKRNGTKFMQLTPELSQLLNIPLNNTDKPVEQKPAAPKGMDAPAQSTNELDYKKALGTLKEFMADKTLDSKETPDLKTLTNGEKQTEYATIAKHHQKLAEEALEKGDDKAFEKHSAIANLAGIINKKIENNSLADGELTKLTEKLLNKIDEKQSSELSIDDILKKLKPDHGEKQLLPYIVPLDELQNPGRLDYKNNKIQSFIENVPKLPEAERELTTQLLADAKNTLEVPQTKVALAVTTGKSKQI